MVARLLSGRLLLPRLIPCESQWRQASARRQLVVYLGPVGACPDEPVLLILIFDNSGSVAGVGGNDPIGQRFDEARLAIETVGKRCRCGKELAATLTFDSPTSLDVAPTPLKGGIATIEQGLAIPPDGGGSSNLGPALRLARRLADRHPEHRTVLCVLSDYQLFDSNVRAVLEELADFPGQVHAVVLRTSPPQFLVDDPRVSVAQVNHGDPPGTLAKVLFGALTATRRHRRAATPRSSRVTN